MVVFEVNRVVWLGSCGGCAVMTGAAVAGVGATSAAPAISGSSRARTTAERFM
jgi:hypothetical protein